MNHHRCKNSFDYEKVNRLQAPYATLYTAKNTKLWSVKADGWTDGRTDEYEMDMRWMDGCGLEDVRWMDLDGRTGGRAGGRMDGWMWVDGCELMDVRWMDGCGRTDRQTDRHTDRLVDGWMGFGWVAGLIDGWVDKGTDGWMVDGRTIWWMDGSRTEGISYGWMDGRSDGWIDGQGVFSYSILFIWLSPIIAGTQLERKVQKWRQLGKHQNFIFTAKSLILIQSTLRILWRISAKIYFLSILIETGVFQS